MHTFVNIMDSCLLKVWFLICLAKTPFSCISVIEHLPSKNKPWVLSKNHQQTSEYVFITEGKASHLQYRY